MKKVILVFLLIAVTAFGNKLELRVEKETNGGYFYQLPHLELKNKKELFLHKLEVNLNFSSPREEQLMPNHHSIDVNNAFGLEYKSFYVTFSLDFRYYIEGNWDKVKPGINLGNTLVLGYEF